MSAVSAELGVPDNVIALPKKKRPPVRRVHRARRVIAIGGGKGGVGKSLITANVGLALARRGARVVVVDGDLGGANLHTCLGVSPPQKTLSDFVDRRVEQIEDVLVPTPYERLSLVSGAHDILDAANLRHAQKKKLIKHLQTLDADFVLLDLGAGSSFNVLDLFLAADRGVVVVLPEPTSIENAYRFIKAAFFRRLYGQAEQLGVMDLLNEAIAGRTGAPRTPFELIARARERSPETAARLELELKGFTPQLVVNQARARGDFDVGMQICSAWKKFFGLDMGFLGAVGHDEAVPRALKSFKPLLVAEPDSAAATGVLRVVENLLALG
jgi:flagellar biosynthesis protein FlhG